MTLNEQIKVASEQVNKLNEKGVAGLSLVEAIIPYHNLTSLLEIKINYLMKKYDGK